jgi:short-subunit dehydrogenase
MNVIITGASRGLGRAVADKFAANGHSLFLSSRDPKLLEEAVLEIKKEWPSVNIHSRAADISKKQEAIELGDWILKQKIPIGVLEKMMAVNLFSAYHLTRCLIPGMIKRKEGHIFNICSIASLKAYDNGGAYSISKFALLGFNRNLREEMKPFNIKVTAILPGAAYTDSWAASGIDPRRIMEANDIAELVYSAAHLSPQACVEEIIVRPQLGDL